MWRWKDRIDRRFMEKFRDLPAMEPPELPPMHAEGLPEAIGDKPMCGGCGAKVGRAALRAGLAPVARGGAVGYRAAAGRRCGAAENGRRAAGDKLGPPAGDGRGSGGDDPHRRRPRAGRRLGHGGAACRPPRRR
ncbi:hypothetical protein ACFOHS_10510 [Jhaorihella thermophila]